MTQPTIITLPNRERRALKIARTLFDIGLLSAEERDYFVEYVGFLAEMRRKIIIAKKCGIDE